MLLLFRKIRKALLQKNKVTTYLTYALGEVILVVVGILIAVNLDNANQARKDNIRSAAYLARLQEDLEVMRTDSEDALRHNRFLFNACLKTKEMLQSGQLLPEKKADMDRYMYRFHQFTISVQDAKSYLEMMNAGELGLIKNRWIRDEFQGLADYRDFLLFVGRSFDDQALDEFEHFEKYVRYDIIHANTDSSRVETLYDFEAMTQDPLLINVISKQATYWRDAIFQHNRYLNRIKVLQDSVNRQIALID